MLSAGDVGPEAVGDQDRLRPPSQEGDLLRNLQPGLQSTSVLTPPQPRPVRCRWPSFGRHWRSTKMTLGQGEGSSHTGSLLKISLSDTDNLCLLMKTLAPRLETPGLDG